MYVMYRTGETSRRIWQDEKRRREKNCSASCPTWPGACFIGHVDNGGNGMRSWGIRRSGLWRWGGKYWQRVGTGREGYHGNPGKSFGDEMSGQVSHYKACD